MAGRGAAPPLSGRGAADFVQRAGGCPEGPVGKGHGRRGEHARVLWGRDAGAVVSTRGSCGKGCGRRGEHARAGELS